MKELIEALKTDIITQLNLQDITENDISDDMFIFGEGLGLDSIDALELIVLLQKKYGVKIQSQEEGQLVFRSVKSMAEFITKNRTVK